MIVSLPLLGWLPESLKLAGYCTIGCCCNTFICLLSVTFSCCLSILICWSSARSSIAGWMFRWFSKRWHNHRSQLNHRRACPWKRCSVPLSLVSRCCRCLHNSPPKLDGSLFISSLTRKHLRLKRGKLRAQFLFRSAILLRFGHGVQRLHRPIVDLQKSTLDGFCDGNQDFLKLSHLLSRFHSVNHLKNAQECLDWIHATHGTFGGTYGYENSCPHINVPLDPKQLMLIWDTGASFGLTPFQSNFIDYVACTIPVQDASKVNNVIGIGTTLHWPKPLIERLQFVLKE